MKDKVIKDRISEVIEDIGGNSSELARRVGVAPTNLSSVIKSEEKGVSATLLKGLSDAGISLDWLVTGNLDMWVNNKDGETCATLKEKSEIVQAKLDDALVLIGKLEYYIDQLERTNSQSEGKNGRSEESVS
tara:strand:- start:165 stop:560 length:396 start_codon:yes stop_codon:yes gene_type:complete